MELVNSLRYKGKTRGDERVNECRHMRSAGGPTKEHEYIIPHLEISQHGHVCAIETLASKIARAALNLGSRK